MTTSEYNQIKEIYKPAQLANDLLKIYNDITDITYILSTIPFNIDNARQKVISINTEHPENHLFFFLINPLGSEVIPVCNASSDSLKQDLAWKKSYLSVKAATKTLDEVVHQLEFLYHTNLQRYEVAEII